MENFWQGLRDLGYVEGQNLIIEHRYAEGSEERLHDLAAELVRLKVEVIVAGGSVATRAAQQATRTIPIVMASSGDPVGLGFVANLARPGGNITGLSNFFAEFPREAATTSQGSGSAEHSRRRVNESGHSITWAEMGNLAVAAKALGVQVQVVHLHSRDELGWGLRSHDPRGC